jgi:hypothetical protein
MILDEGKDTSSKSLANLRDKIGDECAGGHPLFAREKSLSVPLEAQIWPTVGHLMRKSKYG